jgi:hypothetical protein
VQGTVFFKRGDQLAMYLPKLRRELHISPAMLQDPWMGSDFTNQDLLAAGALIGQYRHRVLAREDGVVVIESSPRPETPVTWIRLEQRLREADGLPLAIQYFGAAGSGDRVLRFSAPRTFSGRTVPSRWVMQPLARPDQHTRIEVEELRFGIRPEDALFLPGQASPGPP